MAKAWLVDGRGIAQKVRNASLSSALQIKDSGATRECPNCGHCIDNSDVTPEWPGFPKGVKFEPTDEEITDHLEAKCGVENSKPHLLLDLFIHTVEGDAGINYTHPENLPGTNKDGISAFFFHKTVKAYGTGQRKRRKVTRTSLNEEPVRWHKTGRTKAIILNGVQKGCKRIMVLYKSAKKGSKPEKSNWVLHQYHLGVEGEETGDFVISKIFYQQQKQSEKNDEETDNLGARTSPRTPKTNPSKPGSSVVCDDAFADSYILDPSVQGLEYIPEASHDQIEDDMGYESWLAGESQGIEDSDLNSIEDSLLCKENIEASSSVWKNGVNLMSQTGNYKNENEEKGSGTANFAISDLENIDLGTPPEFVLSELQFASEHSFFSLLDGL